MLLVHASVGKCITLGQGHMIFFPPFFSRCHGDLAAMETAVQDRVVHSGTPGTQINFDSVTQEQGE